MMKAKEYLSQALRLDHRINSKLEQLENLKALAMRVTTNFAQEKVSGGRELRGPFENTMAKIIDLENEINQEIDRFIKLKQEIMETIELGYSRSGVFRIHSEGLKEINKILKSGLKWTKM